MAKVEAAKRRQYELGLGRFMAGEPLAAAEQSELAALEAWLDAVPVHLKSPEDLENDEVRRLLFNDERVKSPAAQRLLSER